MVRISRQLMMTLLLLSAIGCATERPNLRVGQNNQPAARQAGDGYSPVPSTPPRESEREEIPAPPAGASYERKAPEPGTEAPRLQKAQQPPLLLRPITWGFGGGGEPVSLERPAVSVGPTIRQ